MTAPVRPRRQAAARPATGPAAAVSGAAPGPCSAGWRAGLRLGFRRRGGVTQLAERRRYGPLAVQRPFYPEGGVCHVYLLHPPGGVVGGDRLDIIVELGPESTALLTTPGAGKFYRSAGADARQSQSLTVGEGASLEWLPQENILFPGARVAMDTRIHLGPGARLAAWEIHCLGRPAIDEGFERGCLDSRLTVSRADGPVLDERLRVDGDNRRRPALMAGHPVAGTLLFSGATPAQLGDCRGLLPAGGPEQAAATLLDDLLVVRYLGGSTAGARALFTAVWRRLRPAILGRAPAAPRIWST